MTENRSSSPGVKENAESSSPRSEDVLRNIGINVAWEDADLALARALQEQERAFMLFAEQQQQGFAASASSSASQPAQRDLPDRAGSRSEPPVPAADVVVLSDSEAYDDAEDVQYDDEEDDDEEPVGAAQGDGDGEGEAALTDEELALQLQVEEQHAHLLELAGFGPGGAYDEDDLDDEEYYPEDEVDPDNMTYEELQALGDALGTVSKGVPQAVVDALPRSRYSLQAAAPAKRSGSRMKKGSRSPSTESEPDKCAVCQMEFEAGDEVSTLPCSHFYHPDCIGQWLKDRKVCPICGKELTMQKPKPDSQRSSPAVPAQSVVPPRQSEGT